MMTYPLYQYGAHTTFANNNILVRTFAETNQDFGKSNVASDVSNKLGEKNARCAINIPYENLGMELPCLDYRRLSIQLACHTKQSDYGCPVYR